MTQTIQPRDPRVVALIEKAEELLERSGVRALCISCWKGEQRKHTGSVGCCNGCTLLSSEGCTDKPLSCALWLCDYAETQFPEVARTLNATIINLRSNIAEPYKGAFRARGNEIERKNLAAGLDNLIQIAPEFRLPGSLLEEGQ